MVEYEKQEIKAGKERAMLKQHRFWAIVMLVGAVMCFWTGHRMTNPGKKS